MSAGCWVCEGRGARDGCGECGQAADGRRRPFDEPNEFAEWLGRHCRLSGAAVPRAGTARRLLLARVFAALTEAGLDVPVASRGLEARRVWPEAALAAVWGDVAPRLDAQDGAAR